MRRSIKIFYKLFSKKSRNELTNFVYFDVTIIVEYPNELGPFGAKGVGEPPIVGGAPAIRNAVRDALGFPINAIPLTARQVLLAIRTREQCQGGER